MIVRTTKIHHGRSARAVGLVVVLAVALLAAIVPLSTRPAQAQTYTEGPDYKFFYSTFPPPIGTLRQDWSLYGGPEQVPYYIHADIIADGFETAVLNAFSTVQNDPGSNISFVYMGSTTVLSEVLTINDLPQDGLNVVSYRALSGPVGLAGFNGEFFADSNGQPTGEGSAEFDVTLSSTVNWSTTPGPNVVDIESVALHELLHAMALDHPDTNQATVMWDTLQNGTTKRNLHPADQLALAILYGATCNGKPITHDMTALGVTMLDGTAGNDVILGTPGADTINGLGGADTVCAGGGNDTVRGGAGVDWIDGEGGSDTIRGGGGGGTIYGGNGADVLDGQGGTDTIFGGAGGDTIRGRGAADTIFGGGGPDTIDGHNSGDTIDGGEGNDVIKGQTGPDILRGGAGNDDLFGGDGQDTLYGDAGIDKCQGNTPNTDQAEAASCESMPGIEIPF